jgi:hypothetical protein
MEKKTIFDKTLEPTVSNMIIGLYKYLLKLGDKEKLYFFKGIVYACYNPSPIGGWREPQDFLFSMCQRNHDTFKYYVFEGWYGQYKRGHYSWFGNNIRDCIKMIL